MRPAFLPGVPESGVTSGCRVARFAAAALCGSFLLCYPVVAATPRRTAECCQTTEGLTTVELADAAPPPEWALWERQLLDHFYTAAVEFVQRYTREDGTLIWRDEWPGMDGSDDGYESFYNFPLYYALGRSRRDPHARAQVVGRCHQAVHTLWAGSQRIRWLLRLDAPRRGLYEFVFLRIGRPNGCDVSRAVTAFAGLYLGEDPEAANYDTERKLIRSPITGSRGPRFSSTRLRIGSRMAESWQTIRCPTTTYPASRPATRGSMTPASLTSSRR